MPVIGARIDERPDADEVRAALAHMATSQAFRGSPQLVAFLRYVVEATLRGKQDRIKGYTIAVEALGRPDNFNPQHDPIVRVEATRLRRALQRYYNNGGGNEAVQIDLPLGSYVPVFQRRDVSVAPSARDAAGGDDPFAVRPAWYDFLAFLAAYLANDMARAGQHATLILPESDPLGLVARTLVAAHRGEADVVRDLVDRLAASRAARKA
jgi:hypothetical protein